MTRPPRHLWRTAVALFFVGLNLRLALAGVPPLVKTIAADLALSAAQAGALTTVVVACMGLFAPAGHRLGSRFGPARTVLAAVALTGLGSLVRLGGSSVTLLFLGTLLAGLGIAAAGAVLPRLVKELFPPERSGVATGLYMLAMMTGATVASAAAVPLAEALGSWQASLAAWSVVAVVGVLAWFPIARAEVVRPHRGSAIHLPWRHRTAVLVSAYLATQSLQYYSSLAWIPPTYAGHGWSPAQGGVLLAVFNAAQFVGGLVGPAWADRVLDVRRLLVGAVALSVVGEAGIWLAPEAAPYLWVTLMGVGQSAGFAVPLVLMVRYAASTSGSGRLTAMAFFVSYTAASVGPFAFGAVADAAGGFSTVWGLLTALLVVQFALATRLRPSLAKVS